MKRIGELQNSVDGFLDYMTVERGVSPEHTRSVQERPRSN